MVDDATSTTQSDASRRPTGMRGFTIIWFGQLVSLLGTGMTQFALTIWAWQATGEVTALALVALFATIPQIITSPLAGAIVDRWDRKRVMMLSDLAAGISTTVLLLLHTSGQLQVWHLYVSAAFTGAFQAFQFPAYSAAVSTMLPKEQYGRASGMISLAEAASGIVAPIAAGIAITLVGIGGIMAFDILTFIVAIATLLVIHIPRPEITVEDLASRGSLWEDSLFGFKYIFASPSLVGILSVFLALNFIMSFSFTLFAPMILARTGDNTLLLGSVQSAFGVGGVVGGLLMSAWGGPKRKIHGVLLGSAVISLGTCIFGIGRSLPVWAVTSFALMILLPVLNDSSQAIWQAKIPPQIQGRVFSTRALMARVAQPISLALTGPLADWVFEPAMMPGGARARLSSPLTPEEPADLLEPLEVEEPELTEPVEAPKAHEAPESPEQPDEARAWRRHRAERDWDEWGESPGDYIGSFVEDVMEGVAAEIETSFRFRPRDRPKKTWRYSKPGSVDVKRAASVMSALGNANRLKILDALSHGGLYAGDLQEALEDIGASTLSSHLDVLEESGLVTQERRRGRYLITVPGRLAVNMAYEISKRSDGA